MTSGKSLRFSWNANQITRPSRGLLACLGTLALCSGANGRAEALEPLPPGIWRVAGYGWVFDARTDGSGAAYHLSSAGCLPNPNGDVDTVAKTLDRLEWLEADRAFSARSVENITRFTFQRMGSVPPVCLSPAPTDPLSVFDAFSAVFAEHYAFFAQRKIDWARRTAKARAEITARTTGAELLSIMGGLISLLNDSHVAVDAPGIGYAVSGLDAMGESVASDLGPEGTSEAFWAAYRQAQSPLKARADRTLAPNVRHAARGQITWGWAQPKTGYLRIDRFRALAQGGLYADQEATMKVALDQAFGEIGDAPRLILDLRFNTGGFDGLALHLAGRFIGDKQPAFSKAPKAADGLGPVQHIAMEPTGRRPYTGELLVLTSQMTASAAENFLLALEGRRAMARIGETTAGVHSDELFKPLPNGWSVTISNEVFRSAKGELYEARGFHPHLPFPYLKEALGETQSDALLNAAIALPPRKPLKSRKPSNAHAS